MSKSAAKPPGGIALILRAAEFAGRKHRDQRRKDPSASPYINHPLALAEILSGDGRVRSAEVLAAALLHDTLEDTDTTPAELRAAFGSKITGIVQEVTDDKTLPKQRRKELQVLHAPHISRSAKLIKLADKIANLSDIITSPRRAGLSLGGANTSIGRSGSSIGCAGRTRSSSGGSIRCTAGGRKRAMSPTAREGMDDFVNARATLMDDTVFQSLHGDLHRRKAAVGDHARRAQLRSIPAA